MTIYGVILEGLSYPASIPLYIQYPAVNSLTLSQRFTTDQKKEPYGKVRGVQKLINMRFSTNSMDGKKSSKHLYTYVKSSKPLCHEAATHKQLSVH